MRRWPVFGRNALRHQRPKRTSPRFCLRERNACTHDKSCHKHPHHHDSKLHSSTSLPVKMASLLTIPLELLVAVSEYLPTEDLGSLRLVCKQTEKSLYEWFSKEFFFKKQFMLTQPSLQVLLDISRHVSLSKRLKHLIIATNVYDDIPIRFRDSDACSRSVILSYLKA